MGGVRDLEIMSERSLLCVRLELGGGEHVPVRSGT